MRTWARALGPLACGSCRRRIAAAAPYLKIEPSTLAPGRVFVRCAFCADEPVPLDLPAAAVVEIRPTLLTRFDANSLPLDFRAEAPTPVALPLDDELPLDED